MKYKILLLYLFMAILSSCDNANSDHQKFESSKVTDEYLQVKESYRAKMLEKDFSLTLNGPCEDATVDTVHQKFIGYVEAKEIDESKVIVEFKFKDDCCQDFLGDYTITNDTLKFEYENVNGMLCACMCWYRYKLEINDVEEAFSAIEITRK